MNKNGKPSILTFYAISPIYAGCGSSVGAVDLPIQRERHTNWPHIQASGIKGALRSHFREFDKNDIELINIIFGTDDDNDKVPESDRNYTSKDESLPGSISVSDAKLFAFPTRSNIAPFVWVTCPALLKRVYEDLKFAGYTGIEEEKGKVKDLSADIQKEAAVWINQIPIPDTAADRQILLEDAIVEVDTQIQEEFAMIKTFFCQIDRLLCISDEMFKYVVDNFTEVQTQIKIDAETGTAKGGALRYQELLPADTALYSIIYYIPSLKKEDAFKAENIRTAVEDAIKDYIQIGGDETLGRGICKVCWIKGGAE